MPTPLRNVRVPDDVWQAALAAAARTDTSVSAVVVDALRRYAKRHPPRPPRVRCEHEHDVGAAHTLTADCLYPHEV